MSYMLTLDEQQRVVSWIELKDGTRRALYHWPCRSQSAIASLLIVPGLGEHGGRYAECCEVFCERGFDMFAIDLLGHGLSPGERGCITSYDGLLDEIEAAMETIAVRKPAVPRVLWGHSMGGNLVINYLLRRSERILPRCAIATAPMLRASNPPSKAFIWFARKLALMWPSFCIATPATAKDCTRNPRQLEMMERDHVFHKRISLLLGRDLIDSGEWAVEHAQQLRTKLLILHGENDAITSSQMSQQFAERCGELCDFRLLPDHLHDVHRDSDSQTILGSMADWLIAQISAAKS